MRFTEMQPLGAEEKSHEGRVGYFNLLVRRRLFGALESLGIVMPGEAVSEPLRQQNLLTLAPGSHGGSILKKEDTELHGAAPGAVITMPLTINADAVIDGVTINTAAGSGPLVTVNGGVSIFRGCTFEKPPNDVGSQVLVGSLARATFLGCVFRGSGTTASVVVSHPAGAATRVQVAFCYNKTGNTLGNAADVTMTGNL